MGLISAVVNNLSCGANSQLGTGTKFCPQDIENPTVVVFAEKGTKFAPSDDLTLSAIQTLQQNGKLIVLSGVVSFTDNTAENTAWWCNGSTSDSGSLSLGSNPSGATWSSDFGRSEMSDD